ncbi:uncharacterized protein LOC135367975 [Ornithodoros turicata]|uniref:uncharacterized protein LOC135367975 n=1 Tax=Ornithodoros turicata TaxID=34597 RepID=UPI003139B66A
MELTHSCIDGLPKGPWTKQLKDFPRSFCEKSILDYQEAVGASKHYLEGYAMFKAEKVKDVLLHHSTSTTVKGKVKASYTLRKEYPVVLKVAAAGNVTGGHCKCPSGKGGVCKHVGALAWFVLDVLRTGNSYIPDPVSCTEKPQQWGHRSAKGNLNCQEFQQLVFAKHVPGRSIVQAAGPKLKHEVGPTKEALQLLADNIMKDTGSHMHARILQSVNYEPVTKKRCALRPLQTVRSNPISLPTKILWVDDAKPYTPHHSLSLKEAQELEKLTRGQGSNELWIKERSTRVTASHFGDVVRRKAPINQKMIDRIFCKKSHSTKYMRIGQENENPALQRYKQARSVDVFPVGLCVNPGIPDLGASPDGLVYERDTGDYGLVEVKTLAKAKDSNLQTTDAIACSMALFLKDGKLKHTHKYYYQIQGQLALSGLLWCDLVVDSGSGAPFVQRIPFNQELWRDVMLPSLLNFYDASQNNNSD